MPSSLAVLLLPLLLPLALVALLRARALRPDPADPARAWFGYWQGTQIASLIAWVGWIAAQWTVDAAAPIHAAVHALPPVLIPGAGVLVAVVPPTLVSLAIVALSHRVSERLRGEGWSRRELMGHAAWQSAGMVLPLAALLGGVMLAMRSEWRAAVVSALAAPALRWYCERHRLGALDVAPRSITTGALRDRVFGLASAARVRLRMLYVLPTARGRIANAFAVRGDVVVLTDHLIEHLSRREVDAVLAHELAHLRRGHLRWLMMPAVWVMLMVGFYHGQLRGAWVYPSAFLVGLLTTWLLMRRFEFQADRGAVELTHDPEALISALAALARLNDMPLQWSPWAGALLSHPTVVDRARAIGRAGGLEPARVQQVLRDGCGDSSRHELPPSAAAKVFSTALRAEHGRRSTLAMATALALGAVITVVAIDRLQPAWPYAALVLAAGAVAFGAALLAYDRFAAGPFRAVRPGLAARLRSEGIELADAHYVGLSPGARVRVYEGFTDWDLGFLFVRGDRLCYIGEETRFALRRDQVAAVHLGARTPGWVRAPRVVLEWRGGSLMLRPVDIARVSAGGDAAWRLLGVVGAWLDGLAEERPPQPCAALDALTEPALGEVTALTPRQVAHPRTLVPVLVLLGLLVGALGALLGLPLGVSGPPGVIPAWLAAAIAAIALRMPWWWWRERPAAPASADAEQRRAA